MKKFFSGNSIEQVVMTAARHFGIEPDRLAYTTREKKHGFTNVRRKVVIEVDPESYELAEDEVQSAEGGGSGGERLSGRGVPKTLRDRDLPIRGPATTEADDEDDVAGDEEDRDDDSDDEQVDDHLDDAEDDEDDEDEDDEGQDDEEDRSRERRGRNGQDRGRRRPSRRDDDDHGRRGRKVDFVHRWDSVTLDDDEVEELGRETAAFELALDTILDVMDLEIEFTIAEGDTYEVEFSGEDADLLTAEDGRALKAVEHVLPRVIRTLLGESLPVKVDCEGFRADHEDELMKAAREAADEVRRSGREKRMAPMSPGDRRIVHLTLADDPDVDTFSDGRGYRKRVTVRPVD